VTATALGPDELLRRLAAILESLDLPYLVTGSMATVFYGEPRFTNDIDVVVDLPAERITELCAAFPADEFYVDEETVRRAVRNCGQFNVLHPTSGLKVDVMVPAADDFNRSRFARARRLRPGPDVEVTFASPEDVILKKLEYYREGGSEKHLRDIRGVLRVSRGELDLAYVEEWAERLGVREVWTHLHAEE